MKKFILVMVSVMAICFSAGGAQALTSPFFAYDDFKLVFGAAGNPGAAGGVFSSDGKLLEYSNPLDVVGWFQLDGVGTGAQLVGTQYVTQYDGTLKIYQEQAHTTPLWSGSGSVRTIVNADGSVFPAIYPRPPSFLNQPANYNSIGDGGYTGVGNGAYAPFNGFIVDWFGTYNWTYNISSGGTWGPSTTEQYGNAQGGLRVPEPATLLLLGLGLLGVGIVRRKL